jgi:hypothetical protein
MLRRIFTFGALVVVAVTFGASTASAKSGGPPKGHSHFAWIDGFSDGRI